MSKTLKVGPSFVRAAVAENSFNEQDNTVEIVFATETEVPRRSWDGKFLEVLDCNPKSVRLERLNNGGPVLNNHSRWDLSSQIGVVVRAWFENKQGKAIIRFSTREDVKGYVEDVKNGIIRNVSVGYNIYQLTETDTPEGEAPKYRITDWEPMEISLVCIPADHNAGVRSKEEEYYEVEIISNRNMPEELKPEGQERQKPVSAPDTEAIRAQAKADEKKRTSDIRSAAKKAGITDEEFVNDLLSRDVSIESAREAIINKISDEQENIRNQKPPVPGRDEVDKKRAAMENAIQHRANPSIVLTPEGREFRGLTLIDMARECANDAGIKTRGMSVREVAEAALNLRSVGMMSTSDFPIILGNTVNRSLRAEYEIQERTFMPWASRGNAKDFREMSRTSLGEVGDFKEVKEGGEYEYTTLGEGAEKYKVIKYGQIIAITWETLVNDDLDAFSRIPRKIAAAAARKQSDIVYGILTGSHKMSDNKELFHADHGNLVTSGSAISVDSMGVLRGMIRKQKGLDKKDFLNLTPKFMIVGPDNEQLALQYTSANFVANVANNQNVWSGLVQPIVEPRIEGNAWYFAASPSAIDTVEYSFLEGEPELFTEQRNGFDVDGLEIKARMVFGAKAIDWRGLAKNVGA